jgi:hypothetical protein
MKVLYILSSPRSGSTLLSLILGKHPLAANLGEVSFIPKDLATKELCTCGEVLGKCSAWAEVFNLVSARTGIDMPASPYGLYLGDAIMRGGGRIDHSHQTRWRVLMGKLRGGIDHASLAMPPWLGGGRCALPSIRRSIGHTMQLYESAAEAWNKKLVIDASKAPRKGVHLYLHAPERVRIVHLVRDGRGVTASRIKHLSVQKAARHWNYYHTITFKFLQRWVAPAHRRIMRYEDFVTSPETHLRALCEWLELPYSEEVLRFGKDIVIHSAGGNPTRFNISAGIRPADDRWRSLLSTKDLETIDRIAGSLNRALGY